MQTIQMVNKSAEVQPSNAAAGGAWIDDMTLKKDGTTVFSDNFNSGHLAGWYSTKDAVASSLHYNTAFYSMYVNWHNGAYAAATHDVSVTSSGLIELSCTMWMPATSQQWNYGGGATVTGTHIILHCNSTNKEVYGGYWLWPGDAKYRACANGSYSSSGTYSANTWYTSTLSMNLATGSGSFGGRGFSFTPADFPTIDSVKIWSSFGDKTAVPEPSCLLVFASGLAALGLRTRKKLQRHRRLGLPSGMPLFYLAGLRTEHFFLSRDERHRASRRGELDPGRRADGRQAQLLRPA